MSNANESSRRHITFEFIAGVLVGLATVALVIFVLALTLASAP